MGVEQQEVNMSANQKLLFFFFLFSFKAKMSNMYHSHFLLPTQPCNQRTYILRPYAENPLCVVPLNTLCFLVIMPLNSYSTYKYSTL